MKNCVPGSQIEQNKNKKIVSMCNNIHYEEKGKEKRAGGKGREEKKKVREGKRREKETVHG